MTQVVVDWATLSSLLFARRHRSSWFYTLLNTCLSTRWAAHYPPLFTLHLSPHWLVVTAL